MLKKILGGLMIMASVSPCYAESGASAPSAVTSESTVTPSSPVTPRRRHRHHRSNKNLKNCVTSLGLPTLPTVPSSVSTARTQYRTAMKAYFTQLSVTQKSELKDCKQTGTLQSCVASLGLPTLPTAPWTNSAFKEAESQFHAEMKAYFAALSTSQHQDLKACETQARTEEKQFFQTCVEKAGLPAMPQAGSNWQERKQYFAGLNSTQKGELKTCRQQSFGGKS
jgi:hypothetical protein